MDKRAGALPLPLSPATGLQHLALWKILGKVGVASSERTKNALRLGIIEETESIASNAGAAWLGHVECRCARHGSI